MAITPFRRNRTRDPSPSIVCAPSAANKDSMRRHSKAAGGGCEKMASSVLRCALFMK
jgi:hypothetical protein